MYRIMELAASASRHPLGRLLLALRIALGIGRILAYCARVAQEIVFLTVTILAAYGVSHLVSEHWLGSAASGYVFLGAIGIFLLFWLTYRPGRRPRAHRRQDDNHATLPKRHRRSRRAATAAELPPPQALRLPGRRDDAGMSGYKFSDYRGPAARPFPNRRQL